MAFELTKHGAIFPEGEPASTAIPVRLGPRARGFRCNNTVTTFQAIQRNTLIMMVPMEGVEPTHSYEYQILSLARLPIPPRRLWSSQYISGRAEVNQFRLLVIMDGARGIGACELWHPHLASLLPSGRRGRRRVHFGTHRPARRITRILSGQIFRWQATGNTNRQLLQRFLRYSQDNPLIIH